MSGIDWDKHFPPKLLWLPGCFDSDYRYIVLKGGRSGAKSTSVSKALILRALAKRERVVCLRERQNSIAESSKETLEQSIVDLGMEPYFRITHTMIKAITTGSEFIFRGLSSSHGTDAAIKSLANITIAWIDEAQAISERSWEILEPTVRKGGSKIVVTYNPTDPSDIVHKIFGGAHKPPDAYVQHINYDDNPFTSQETLNSIEYDRVNRPNIYAHKWMGECEPDIGLMRVLRRDVLDKCVGLYERHSHLLDERTYEKFAGYDVADLGEDMCALAIRQGPFLTAMHQWRGYQNAIDGVRRLDNVITGEDIWRVYYDASGGYGISVRSGIEELARQIGQRPYAPRPVQFGGEVCGKDAIYDQLYTNGQMFLRRNSQMAWLLRMRADNTVRLSQGGDVDPDACLFINPAIIDNPETSDILQQLNQPCYDTREGGKIRLTKADPSDRSPDMFDATCLVFARDSEEGLRL